MGIGAKGWTRQLDSLSFIHNILRISWLSIGVCESIRVFSSLMRLISIESIISGNTDAAQLSLPLAPFLFLSHSSPFSLFPAPPFFPLFASPFPLHLRVSLQWDRGLSSGSGLPTVSLENHSLSLSPPVPQIPSLLWSAVLKVCQCLSLLYVSRL